MVELKLTMNSDVNVGGADIVTVGVKLDVEVEAHAWRGKPEGPNLRAVILGRKGRGIVLWENNIKTKYERKTVKARPDPIKGSGHKSPNNNNETKQKNTPAHDDTDNQHVSSRVAWQTIQHSVAAEC